MRINRHTFSLPAGRALALIASVLSAFLVPCRADPVQAVHAAEAISFVATVNQVQSKFEFSGTALVVTFDPRFIASLTIKATKSTLPDFAVGKNVNLFIHSPSQVFGPGPVAGRDFAVELTRSMGTGRVVYSGLSAKPIP